MSEYNPRRCPTCGADKSRLGDDGREVLLACPCDWQAEFLPRVQRTVDPAYMGMTMGNWNPNMYSEASSGAFKRLAKAQKITLVQRVWDYAFKPVTDRSGRQADALARSVDLRRNFYVRGPRGSGVGLVLAAIKTLAAGRGITATPLPSTFDSLMDDLVLTRQFGEVGMDARCRMVVRYEEPSLLVIEGMRKPPRNSRYSAAEAADRMMAKRSGVPGCILASGRDFLHEVGDSLGERFLEVMLGDDTDVAVLLSVPESDALLSQLVSSQRAFAELAKSIVRGDVDSKSGVLDRMALRQQAESVEQLLYFEDACPRVPASHGKGGAMPHNAGDMLRSKEAQLPEPTRAAMRAFAAAKEASDATYAAGLARAREAVARACPALQGRLSDKEAAEVGRLLGVATLGDDAIKAAIEAAKELRARMSA